MHKTCKYGEKILCTLHKPVLTPSREQSDPSQPR